MRESRIERHLRRLFMSAGWLCVKLQGTRGWPDRLILGPGGQVCFVELKAPGKKQTQLQSYHMEALMKLGFDVRLIDTIEGADALFYELTQGA